MSTIEHEAAQIERPVAGVTTDPSTTARPIRVLWLIKGLGRGGAEMLLYHAAELRDRDAFDCQIAYLLGSRSWLADDLRSLDVPIHLLDSERHGDLRWARRLRALLLDEQFDVVHVHSPLVAAVARLVVRSLPRGVRPPTISTEHLHWSGHARWTRMVNRATFRLDRMHIAVSDAVVESIPRRLRNNVRVLMHGIPVEKVRARRQHRAEVRQELGISDDEVLVGTVANLTAQKAYPVLLEAARLVIGRGRRVRFVAAGRGKLEGEVRALAADLGLGDAFRILGPVEDASRLLAGLDVFALASHWEGLPLAVMEAKAIGLPIVATNVGGVPELVRDGVDGLLVEPGRPDALADGIDRLVTDPELRHRLARAASDDAGRLDNRHAVRTIEDIYRELADRVRS